MATTATDRLFDIMCQFVCDRSATEGPLEADDAIAMIQQAAEMVTDWIGDNAEKVIEREMCPECRGGSLHCHRCFGTRQVFRTIKLIS